MDIRRKIWIYGVGVSVKPPETLKVHWHAIFLLHFLKAGVSMIILTAYIPDENVYFLSYINLKFQKGNPKYIFCT